jgi:hypothetical protein
VTDSRFGAESSDDLERYDQRYNGWSDDR